MAKLDATLFVTLSFLLLSCIVGGAWGLPPGTYNSSQWMAEMKDYVYNRSLLQITLPGTHDSGAYEFSDQMSPLDSKVIDFLIELVNDLHFDIYQFIKNWSQTQDMTIYEQLMGGIRYLDLRACYVLNNWYTQHFLLGTMTQDLLNDIQKFMSQSPGELIVVQLGELVPADQELGLIQMIQKILGPWLAPRQDLMKTTVGKMVENNHRIVLLYPPSKYHSNFTFLWSTEHWVEGSYADKDKLTDMEDWNGKMISVEGGHGKIFELSWTLTTQISDIVRTLLDPFAKENNLKDFALEADGALDLFVQTHTNYMLGNILLVDWWQYSNVVEVAQEFNLRNCNDDPKFVPVVPDGQYCRFYSTNGNCTNAKYEQWMSEHCRLSCGYC